MTTGEIAAVQRAIGELRRTVSAVRSRHGDTAPVLRLLNDVDRLSIDAADLAGRPSTPTSRPRPSEPLGTVMIEVPDTPYDPDLWRGADDEGVGGHLRRHH